MGLFFDFFLICLIYYFLGSPRGRGNVMKFGRKLSISAPKKAINGASRSRDDSARARLIEFCDFFVNLGTHSTRSPSLWVNFNTPALA